MHSPENISRYLDFSHPSTENDLLHPDAFEMIEQFNAERQQAQEALLLGQYFQKRAYNKGQLSYKFEEGDLDLINPHSLSLLKSEKGRGKKLLMRYDGPFKIVKKISLVSYQLQMPASYRIYPVLNIAHLEKYHTSPSPPPLSLKFIV